RRPEPVRWIILQELRTRRIEIAVNRALPISSKPHVLATVLGAPRRDCFARLFAFVQVLGKRGLKFHRGPSPMVPIALNWREVRLVSIDGRSPWQPEYEGQSVRDWKGVGLTGCH